MRPCKNGAPGGSLPRAVGSQRDRDVDPPAALAAADPDPDERPE